MKAMILAAGRGERLRPVTDHTPKALVEVGGVSLLERHLRMLANNGVETVVINLGWLGEKIVERVGSGRDYGLQVIYSPEFDEVLETGGGIVRALPLLGRQPFWVINADVLTDWQVPALPPIGQHLAHLVLVPTPAHKTRGDFDIEGGMLANRTDAPYTFSGIACYTEEFFRDRRLHRFPLAPLLQEAADLGHIGASLFEGRWHDVGSPERLSQLAGLYSR